MEFEFAPAKSASNLEKHGIDFAAVQAVWHDVMQIEVPARCARATVSRASRAAARTESGKESGGRPWCRGRSTARLGLLLAARWI